MTEKAISIQNVSKSYEEVDALKDLTLDIEKGEFFGYLGPNGAGKTTTINILMGLADMDEGSAEIYGHDVVEDYQEARKLVGLSPQEFNFDPYFPIRKLLRYQAGYHGIPREEAYARADELLERFGLEDKADKKYRKLSGGMKRRLAIAKAMVHDPEILILDEPTAGLDVELRLELWDYMTKINEQGKTILLTTHYIEEAQKLCNRIGILNKGELIALDKKENLMDELSHKHLKVRTQESLKKVPKPVQSLKEDSEVDDHSLIIHLHPDSNVDHIVKKVQESVKIMDLRTERESLEEIFVRMIQDG